jgi:hypothetical protein
MWLLFSFFSFSNLQFVISMKVKYNHEIQINIDIGSYQMSQP